MKLFNVIVVYDVYAVAETEEQAIEAITNAIVANEDPSTTALAPSEKTAIESREARNVRAAWVSEKPFVGADVSDDDYEQVRGKTTLETHALIYTKAEAPK